MQLGLANSLVRPGGDGPSLALDFLASALDSRLTFSRASAATDIIGGTLVSFATDAPRISAVNGLLIEGSRTNQATNSNLAATAGGTHTGGQSDPAGGTGAILFTEDTGSTGHQMSTGSNIAYVSGTTYVASAFFKKGTCDKVQMFLSASIVATGDCYANFDLTNGAVTASGASVSNAAVQALAGGWYRCSLRFTASASGTNTLAFCTLATGSETRAPAFAGTSRTYTVYGAQVEAGAFLSSFIPTTTAAATRAADLCTMATGSWFNTNEGTAWVEARPDGIDTAAATSPRLFILTDGSLSLHEVRRNAADSTVRAETKVSCTSQSTLVGAVWGQNVVGRAAYAWKNNDMGFCFAGGTVQTDPTSPNGMPTGITVLRLGANAATSGFFFGWLRRFKAWTRRIGDNQLGGMTQ